MLGGLHPDDVDTRVQRALDQVRPYLGSHAGGVSLSGVDADGVVHLRLEGSCDGCPSSALTVKSAIEDAILVAAPDVVAVEAEGMVDEEPKLLQIQPFRSGVSTSSTGVDSGGWVRLELDVPPGTLAHVHAGDAEVVVANLSGTLVAYVDRCPVCLQARVARDARRRRAHLRLRDVVRRAPRGPRVPWQWGRRRALAAAAAAARGGCVEGRGPRGSQVVRRQS